MIFWLPFCVIWTHSNWHTDTFKTLASSYLKQQIYQKWNNGTRTKWNFSLVWWKLCRCFFLTVNWLTNNWRVLCKTIERNRRSGLCSEYLAFEYRKRVGEKLNETFLTYNSCSMQTLSVNIMKKKKQYTTVQLKKSIMKENFNTKTVE